MRPIVASVVFILLAVVTCLAQESATPSQTSTTEQQPKVHADIPAVLAKSVDSKKLKEGDEIVAKTSIALRGASMIIPSGSKVIGHVTQAQARSKGDSQSSLGIVFDKIELPGGKEWPIHGVIHAVSASANPEPTTGAAGGGTLAKESGSDQGATTPGPAATLTDINSMNPDQNKGKLLNAKSSGVTGIKNLGLDENSVLVSNAKELKLESGTQLLIRSEILQPAP